MYGSYHPAATSSEHPSKTIFALVRWQVKLRCYCLSTSHIQNNRSQQIELAISLSKCTMLHINGVQTKNFKSNQIFVSLAQGNALYQASVIGVECNVFKHDFEFSEHPLSISAKNE